MLNMQTNKFLRVWCGQEWTIFVVVVLVRFGQTIWGLLCVVLDRSDGAGYDLDIVVTQCMDCSKLVLKAHLV